jgi:ketosteroid isomerase-like protein
MYRLCVIAAFIVISPSAVAAQATNAEQEVRAFLGEYDRAVANRDIAFLERVLPEDYVFTGANGRKSNRAQVLKFLTQERASPSYRMVSLKHENVVVRAVGDMAVVTNDYTSRTTPFAASNAEPDSNSGRHTGVFEKRNGHWMVIAEQDTELIHDDKLMERQVTKAGRAYNELLKRLRSGRSYAELERDGDIGALRRILSEEYVGTSATGEIAHKAQELDRYRSTQVRLVSADLLDQKVLAIDNNAALETGTVRYAGTNGGEAFDITTRYTATWVSWGSGWQIVARHSSVAR